MRLPDGCLICIPVDKWSRFRNSRLLYSNCFTFITGFDDNFLGELGVRAIRPENIGWTNLKTKQEWENAVRRYFDPSSIPPQSGSQADRLSNFFFYKDYPTCPCICWPMITGANDYHWAYEETPGIWVEQAGRGGPLLIWDDKDKMIRDVYTRKNKDDNLLYVSGSHFYFAKRK